MPVKCGNCKQYHSGAKFVKACYEVSRTFPGAVTTARPSTTQWAKTNQRSLGVESKPARATVKVAGSGRTTSRMAWYIKDLTVQLAEAKGQTVKFDQDEFVAGWMEATYDEGHETIDRLKADIAKVKAERQTQRADLPAVPDGRYALRNKDDVVKFYVVNSPKEGRWAGRTFVDAQASDERWPIKAWAERERIINEIAADIEGALTLYGRELGKCGHCGRTLTDETSRARGIGPVCASKLGF